MISSPFSHRLTRSFGVLLALLLFLVAFSLANFRSLSEANQWNIHTYEVITNALEMESTLTAIDTSARGFIVSGEKNGLDSYHSQLRVYSERFGALRSLTSDNPIQQLNLNQLDARKRQWTDTVLAPIILERQNWNQTRPGQPFDAAASSARRRAALNDLNKITRSIVDVEEQLLLERTEAQERLKGRTQFTLLLGSAFSILLTAYLVAYASKNARRLDHTNALLGEAKARAEAANADRVEITARGENEIAARRAADERLRRSVLDLQRSNAELEQFAYVASHDLQEPLRAVGGCVQVLQRRYEGKLDARADQFIQHAVDGAHRMQNLINDLLSYSRAGTRTRAFEPVEGAQIVAAALQSVSVARAESGAQISVDEMPTLICDAGQIEQVLQNLLSNALKFRGATAPAIHIGYHSQVEAGANFHVLSVEDAGLGIEAQYFERIFVMFQRLHTRTDYVGTGIGLAICKKIVERHGGKIWVESWTGEDDSNLDNIHNDLPSETHNGARHGSKFSFSLPFEPENCPDESLEMPRLESASSGAETATEIASLSL